MIIDFRIRPPFGGFSDLHIFRPRDARPDPVRSSGLLLDLPEYRSFSERSMDAFMEEMDEAGIDVGVVMGRNSPAPYGSVPNSDVARIVADHPGRFVGFGAVDGSASDALDQVRECVDLGFRGVAMDNGWCSPALYDDADVLMPVYERIAAEGLILSLTSSIFVGPDMSYCMPIHIQRVALRFPELTIVVPHGCWPYTAEACGMAFQCRNVYLAPDFYGHIPNTPGAEEYIRSANYFMGHRLLFASSYPVRPLGQSVEQFRALPFKDEATRALGLGANAARLLGLEG